MKQVFLTFIMLIGIAYGQSTVYLRADSVKIMKQNGNANLQILNATRDTTNGVLINVGNGVTAFSRIRALNDSQFLVGTDTVELGGGSGTGGSSDSLALLRNPTIAGYAILDFSSYVDTVYGKRFLPGYGILFDSTATTITPRVDTTTLGLIVRGYGWQILGNTLATDGRLGTNSNHDIHIYTNNTKRAEITNGGQFLWNASSSPLAYNFYVADTLHAVAIRLLPSGTLMNGSTANNAILGIKGATTASSEYLFRATSSTNVNQFSVTSGGLIFGEFGSVLPSVWTMADVGTIRSGNVAATASTFITFTGSNNGTWTTGAGKAVRMLGQYVPTSGTGEFTSLEVSPIVDKSGGSATGQTWSLKIRPTTISDLTHRYLEISDVEANWPKYYIQQARVATTNATVTTLHTFNTEATTLGTNSYIIIANIHGNRTGGVAGATGDVGTYLYVGRFKRVAGTVTLIAETLSFADESQAGWDVTTSISGTNILLQVTGATDNNISWHMSKGEVSWGGD